MAHFSKLIVLFAAFFLWEAYLLKLKSVSLKNTEDLWLKVYVFNPFWKVLIIFQLSLNFPIRH